MKEYEAMPEKGDPADLPEVCRAVLLSMQHTEFCWLHYRVQHAAVLRCGSYTDVHCSDQ